MGSRGPDFVVIGVQDGGTTAAVRSLSFHPRIHVARGEPNVFVRGDYLPYEGRNWTQEDYETGVVGEKLPGHVYGETSPCIAYMPRGVPALRALYPQCKLVLFLRHPLRRLVSQIKLHTMQNRGEQAWGRIDAELANARSDHDVWDLVKKSLYEPQLARVFDAFPRERVHVEILERMQARPDVAYGKIAEFLGVGPFPEGVAVDAAVGTTATPPKISPLRLAGLIPLYTRDVERVKTILDDPLPEWRMPKVQDVQLDSRRLADLACLRAGAFAPLRAFMGRADFLSVLQRCRLADGTVFPLPVTLWVPDATPGDVLRLLDHDNKPLAVMRVDEVFDPQPPVELDAVVGCQDAGHPYAADVLSRPCRGVYVAGEIQHVDGVVDPVASPPGSPTAVRALIRKLGWTHVVGFQTRNPMHKCHVALARYALSQLPAGPNSGLLLHPVVGPTQPGDLPAHIRVRCYRAVLPHLPLNTIFFALPIAMRMAGPREAVWHALIRKNYGCTHFVIGRDHAGPSVTRADGSPFYDPMAAHALAEELCPDIGITVIPSAEIVYHEESGQYVPRPLLPPGATTRTLSGTVLRKLLAAGQEPPEWFAFPEVARQLAAGRAASVVQRPRRGTVIFATGIPAAGKTTLCQALVAAIQTHSCTPVTFLDADNIRRHLSKGLGFSDEDRSTNVRRIGFVCAEVARAGGVAIVANIAPFADDRAANRAAVEAAGGKFVLVHVDTALDVCRERDPKGLYAQQAAGMLHGLTGVDGRYDLPDDADVVCRHLDVDVAVQRVLQAAAMWVTPAMFPAIAAQVETLAKVAGARITAAGVRAHVMPKPDSSPVTRADLSASHFLGTTLVAVLSAPVVCEETWHDTALPQCDTFWVVDPLDGTKEFLEGDAHFTVNVALVRGGVPVVGVIHAPALGDTETCYEGLRRQPAPASPDGPRDYVSKRHVDEADLAGAGVTNLVRMGSSWKYVLACREAGSRCLRPGPTTMAWDTCAASAIARSYGKQLVLDEDGTEMMYVSGRSIRNGGHVCR